MKTKLGDVELLVYDFDGVMTDNTVLLSEDGTESVTVNRSDGLAVSIIRSAGLKQVILSTEENKVVTARARKLKIPAIQGLKDKKAALLQYCRKNKIDLRKTVYVGNDINDLAAMEAAGCPVCPSDAAFAIKRISKIVLKTPGGKGVVRELQERLNVR